MGNPLHHFELHPWVHLTLFGFDISINYAVVMMWLVCGAVFGFFVLANRRASLVPGRLQNVAEMAVVFLRDMLEENIGPKGRSLLPFFVTLFFFILFCNLGGLFPGAYTATSQIFVTGALALMAYGVSVLYGFRVHGVKFLKILVPPGVPMILIPIMIPIEFISQMARPFSLAVRLFANMTAGHTALAVFFGLAIWIGLTIGWLPFIFTVALWALETFVAFIQAYIFTTLTMVYVGDAVHLH